MGELAVPLEVNKYPDGIERNLLELALCPLSEVGAVLREQQRQERSFQKDQNRRDS